MEQSWYGNTLSVTAAWKGSLEQMHGTDLEWKYFVWNSCMEEKSGTDAWNRAGMEIRRTERKERGMEIDIPPRTESRLY